MIKYKRKSTAMIVCVMFVLQILLVQLVGMQPSYAATLNSSSVSTSKGSGTYGIGTQIDISVSLSSRVTVTGTPQLLMNTGSAANYTGTTTSSTNSLKFTYVVQPGDSTNKLDYVSQNALILNGGTIKSGNTYYDIVLPMPTKSGSLSYSKTIIIDGIAPTSTPQISINATEPTLGSVTATITNWGDADVRQYKMDDGSWTSYTSPITITKNGTLYARGLDLVDNSSPVASLEISNVVEKTALQVLEVQPGTQFELNADTIKNNYSAILNRLNKDEVVITKLSMPEFVSKIDQLNGKFDIIYIGNYESSSTSYSAIGSKASKNPHGNTGSSYAEYYSGNEITNKRAQDVLTFIQSKQLIVFRSSIFNSSLSGTKLYNNFNSYRNNATYPNVLLTTTNLATKNASLDTIMGALDNNTLTVKKPTLALKYEPRQYNGTDASYGNYDAATSTFRTIKELSYTYDIYNPTLATNRYKVNLYIDLNGDGIFKAEELVQSEDNKAPGYGYSINYRMPDTFTGLQPWKLEVVDKTTNAASYEIGSTAFKGTPLVVRVLQLTPPGGSSLSLSSLGSMLTKTNEYTIYITEMPVDKFDSNYPNPYNGKPTLLNGNYDMVIMGFADVYGNGDLKNAAAVSGLRSFIETKQSVMFTHDTMTFRTYTANDWAYNLTAQFRTLVGQNIYDNPVNQNKKEALPEAGKISFGYTRLTLDRANNGDSFPTATNTYKINDGLITQYPYVLGDISVATTHHQYFQLNLEDEDVVPWYTLTGDSRFNKADGRNDYYTYTKGTITYSGTGHSAPNGTPEKQLFVNTMIKAVRGANQAPTMEVTGITNGQNILLDERNLSFRVNAMDNDDSDLTLKVYINNELKYTKANAKGMNDVSLNISNIIYGVTGSFTVRVEVLDPAEAKAEQSFVINRINKPMLDLNTSLDKAGYLTGDTVTVNYTATGKNLQSTTTINNITLGAGLTGAGISNVNSTGWTFANNKYNTGLSNISNGSLTQSKAISFQVNQQGSYTIANSLQYNVDSPTLTGESASKSFSLNVKSGIIHVEVYQDGKGKLNIPIKLNNNRIGSTSQSGLYNIEGLSTGSYNLELDDTYMKSLGYLIKSVKILKYNSTSNTWVDAGSSSQSLQLNYNDAEQKIVFDISGDPIVLNMLSSNDGNATAVIRNGIVEAKVRMDINKITGVMESLDKVKFTLEYPINGLRIESVRVMAKGADGMYKNNSSNSINFALTQRTKLDALGNTVTYYVAESPETLPSGSYEIYFLYKVGNNVVVGNNYDISITKVEFTNKGVTAESDVTGATLKIEIVNLPKLQ